MQYVKGQVKFTDNTIMYFKYDSLVHIVWNHIWRTKEDMLLEWNEYLNHNSCICGKDENVKIAVDIDGGFWWNGQACQSCHAFTQSFGPGLNMKDNGKEYSLTMEEYKLLDEFQGLPIWYFRDKI